MSAETIRGYYHHTAWTPKDGAPQGIWAITQTPDGWLWLGGSFGLARFDGVKFEPVDMRPAGSIETRVISALYSSRGGDIWVAYHLGGAVRAKQGKTDSVASFTGLPDESIHAFSEDGDGRMWAATRNHLWVLKGTNWNAAGSEWGLPAANAIVDQTLDAGGSLWVGTDHGFYVLHKGARRFERVEDESPGLTTMGLSDSGQLWKRDKAGYALIKQQHRPSSSSPPIFSQLEGNAEILARDGSWWSVDCPRGICRADPVDSTDPQASRTTANDSFTTEDGLSSDRAMELYEDREGNIWVGTKLGLDQFRRNVFVSVQFPQPLTNFSLVADSKSGIWAGTHLGYANSSDSFWQLDPNPSRLDNVDQTTYSVYSDSDGSIFVGGKSKLWHLVDRQLTPLPPLPSEIQGRISRLIRAETGNLWVGVDSLGTFEVVGQEWVPQGKNHGFGDRAASVAVRAVDGATWLGYSDNRILVVKHGEFHVYSKSDGLLVGVVSAILAGPPMLVGGDFGLELFDGRRFAALQTDRRDVLKGISGIVKTKDGALWLFTSHGAVQISAAEYQRAVSDPTYRMRVREYDSEDGLPGVSQPGFQNTTLIEDKQGRIWFAGSNGLAWMNPNAIPHNAIAPSVDIRSIVASAKSYPTLNRQTLPAGTRNIEINYTALSLKIPSRVQFRAQLLGVDPVWRDLGAARNASYSNLGPGQFRFQVKASNNDGVWSETPAFANFVIAPLFYQTRLFYTSCGVATLLILWQLYRLRVREVTKQVQGRITARLEERERIARELHDTLLQSTQGLILLFQGFAGQLERADALRVQMEGALDQADELLNEARNRVGDLRTTQLISNIDQAIARYGIELFSNGATTFILNTSGPPRMLNAGVTDEVYRIVREALTNAHRHANASNVEVEVQYEASDCRVRIRDDGAGFDDPSLRESSRPGHFGILGMRERAKTIGARLDIWSRDKAGTEVQLLIPASVAYHDTRPKIRRITRMLGFLTSRHQM